MRNTHLLPFIFYPGLGGTRSLVPFRMRTSYSSYITLTHLGPWRAWATVQGSGIIGMIVVRPYFGMGLRMEFLERVYMG